MGQNRLKSHSERLKGIIFILLAAIFWSFIGPFGSIAMERNIAPLEVVFWRCFLAGSTFLVIAVLTKQKLTYTKKDIPFLLGWVVVGILLNFISYMFAVHTVGNGLASILLYTAPLWIMLLSVFLYKENPRLIQILALIIGLAGIIAICWPSDDIQISKLGIIWGLASGLGYALQYFFNNSRLKKQSIFFNFAIVLLMASFLLFPFVDFAHKTPTIWISLIALGSIATVMAYAFWSLSMRYLTPITVSIIALLEPTLATLWGVSFFGEQPSPLIYIGGVLILSSAVMITITPSKT